MYVHVHVQAIIIRATPNRWLKKWGLTMASEKRQRELAQQWSPDCVQAEYVPFSFRLSNGGEEMRPAPFAYIPDIWNRLIQLLDDMNRYKLTCMHQIYLYIRSEQMVNHDGICLIMCRAKTLTWHDGLIPDDEIWIKLGGDKGQGSFKMALQVCNTRQSNSSKNTFVFCLFQAGDSPTNLHIALDRYRHQLEEINATIWKYVLFTM